MEAMKKLLLAAAALAARVMPNWAKQMLYRQKFLARLIRESLNRASPGGVVQVRIAAGGLAGCQFWLDQQQDKDLWLGTYEPELQYAIRSLVPQGAVVYDVGANIGYISLLFARRVGKQGRVFAFEALPANVELLGKNLALNGMDNRVLVIQAAVTDASQPVRFLVHASPGMGRVAGSAGRQDDFTREITVQGVSLDGFVYDQGNPPPWVVKMDIEGGEVLALPGMKHLLAEVRPLMLMDLHSWESCARAWQVLSGAGYSIHRMKRGFPLIASVDELGKKAYVVGIPPEGSK
jgi:FkbM family methyltransferase